MDFLETIYPSEVQNLCLALYKIVDGYIGQYLIISYRKVSKYAKTPMDFQGKLVSKQSICLQTANTNSRHQLSLMTLQLHFVLSLVLFLRNFKSRFYVMSFLPRKDEVPCRAVLKYDKNQWTFQEKFYVKPSNVPLEFYVKAQC